eukprot:Hpha_TRINITY_DN11021_c0_g1::TRINITY_DN11021_c0_g1_i1::g.92886::m.92886
MTLCSVNVTSLKQARLQALAELKPDVIALQEVRVSEVGRDMWAPSIKTAGYKAAWGTPPQNLGGVGCAQGGLAMLRRTGTAGRVIPPACSLDKELHDSTRVLHSAVAYGDGGRVLHLINVYMPCSDANLREQLLRGVFEMAAGLG